MPHQRRKSKRMKDVTTQLLDRFVGTDPGLCGLFQLGKDYREEAVPYGIFPDSPGLLPWGTDDNGGSICWLTQGAPEKWPILAVAARSEYFEQFDIPMTTFLAGCFTRKITCHLWNEPVFFSGPKRIRFQKADRNQMP